jgi:hypothetical protein
MQRTAAPAGYETDFALWAQSQATALRERRFDDLDLSNLIEEIDDLSKRDRDAIRSRMTTLAFHLLKLHYQPERASGSWLGTIVSRATRIRRLIDGSPSLRVELLDYERTAYSDARPQASAETGLPITNFPEAPTAAFIVAYRAALAGEDFGGDAIVREAKANRANKKKRK